MIRFNNAYNHGAHPEILEALSAVNDNSFGAVSYTHLRMSPWKMFLIPQN